MADIAMLVAEEYERRVRVSRSKVGSELEKRHEIDLVSFVANLGQKAKTKLGHPRVETVKLAVEPKARLVSQLSMEPSLLDNLSLSFLKIIAPKQL